VEEDAKESGKSGWANFKGAVWHEAFLQLLGSIQALSKSGYWHKFRDGEEIWLFPLILILSSDYEEQ
jgi:hypothetical protein